VRQQGHHSDRDGRVIARRLQCNSDLMATITPPPVHVAVESQPAAKRRGLFAWSSAKVGELLLTDSVAACDNAACAAATVGSCAAVAVAGRQPPPPPAHSRCRHRTAPLLALASQHYGGIA